MGINHKMPAGIWKTEVLQAGSGMNRGTIKGCLCLTEQESFRKFLIYMEFQGGQEHAGKE